MLPSPLKILTKDQNLLEIEGAAAWSRKVVDHFDASTYRNTFIGNLLTLNPRDVAASSTEETNTATLAGPAAFSGTLENHTISSVPFASTKETKLVGDDVANAIEPRPWKKPRTRIDFWDGAIGFALAALEVTLANGDAEAVVPDNERLFPGQAISGTNIPTNTIILSVPFDHRTKIILSNKATGAGDTTAVLTGSNWIGGYFEDEDVGEGFDAVILS